MSEKPQDENNVDFPERSVVHQLYAENAKRHNIVPFLQSGEKFDPKNSEVNSVVSRWGKCIIRDNLEIPADKQADIFYYASIIKPFFSLAFINVLKQEGLTTITVSADDVSALYQELLLRKEEAYIARLAKKGFDIETGEEMELPANELVHMADSISSNVAASIIKNYAANYFAQQNPHSSMSGADQLEAYLKQEFGLKSVEINKNIGPQRRSNTGSLQEITKAFHAVISHRSQLPDEFNNSLTNNPIDFKFDISQQKSEVAAALGLEADDIEIYEKTGVWYEVDWPYDLALESCGYNPVHAAFSTIFSIVIKSTNEVITMGKYMNVGRPSSRNLPEDDTTTAKSFDEALKLYFGPIFRAEIIKDLQALML